MSNWRLQHLPLRQWQLSRHLRAHRWLFRFLTKPINLWELERRKLCDLYAVGEVQGHADHKSTMCYRHLANET